MIPATPRPHREQKGQPEKPNNQSASRRKKQIETDQSETTYYAAKAKFDGDLLRQISQ